MAFHLDARPQEELKIGDRVYIVMPHPVLADYAYFQEGRQAWVCQVQDEQGINYALKVFKPGYSVPSLVALSARLETFAVLPGLKVCRRQVLTPERHKELLKQYPELLYAVVMPWIEGPTWMEVLQENPFLSMEQSLRLARALLAVLCRLEQEGLAHCDLSGPNVLLPEMIDGGGAALVDVEDIFGPALNRPARLPGGSLGYGHKMAPDGIWSLDADRFAGAVLLSEMLGWCDPRISAAAFQSDGNGPESYFDPQEVQTPCPRHDLLAQVLQKRWGSKVAELFEQAWHSDTLGECPTFGEWWLALPDSVPAAGVSTVLSAAVAPQASPVPQEEKLPETVDQNSLPESPKPVLSEGSSADAAPFFTEGVAALQRGERARAKELLEAAEQIEPGYQAEGVRAADLLREIETPNPSPSPSPFVAPIPAFSSPPQPPPGGIKGKWVLWGLLGLAGICVVGTVLGLLAVGGYTLLRNQWDQQATPGVTPQVAAVRVETPSVRPTRTPAPTSRPTRTPVPVEGITIRVRNQTDKPICSVYISGSDEDSWGDNRVENRISPNKSFEWTVPEGTYDVMVQNCDDITVQTAWELTENSTVLVGGPGKVAFYVINESQSEVCYLYIAVPSKNEWGDDVLGNKESVASKDGQRIFYIDPGTYDLLAQDCDGENLVEKRNVSVSDGTAWTISD